MMQFQENTRTDGRMDRPYFIGPFRLPPGVQKVKQSFRAIDMENNILNECF